MAQLATDGRSTSYLSLLTILGNRDRRKIGNNTWLERAADRVHVRLHSTIVATIYSDDVVEVNSGGWMTTTTKDRINAFLPSRYVLGQTRREWFVYDRFDNWHAILFQDHMCFAA